ncbi:methyltransferase domain-containing protein [Paracoccus sp. S-4012]|uniref:methyltransferase domain-containing protein n=1 Tax=Paracoccus sp. S-4012 TaxID=2665648 RepID=UPI0012B13A01|nr:methyltransferase domain-containing protein [Paracoccus sp. S-4012]MRX49278.1 methyltransferase domain-containing protein [Paracoccus sp. S-4012]
MTSAPSSPRRLTDRARLELGRARARRQGPVTLLHDLAADEIKDRLAEINRRFTDLAVVSGWPDTWSARFPTARQVADAEVLDLAPASLDLVIHALALHWADDPVGQMVQAARALRPDGLFLAVLPGGESLAGLRAALSQAEVELTGGLSPHVLPMGDLRDLGGLISRAGLALPVADSVPVTLSYRDMLHLGRELRAMGEGNAMADRRRQPLPRAVLAHAAQLYAEANPDPDDPARVLARIELIFLTGWAPAPSQPKPLRPGSATVSLADALARARPSESEP